MDKESNDYAFGVLGTQVRHLETAVTALTAEVHALRGGLEEIHLFRAKILGMATAASFVVSLSSSVIIHAITIWAK